MADTHPNIKTRILHQLYLAEGNAVSGVFLSRLLNISRVAVWKHIDKLKSAGVNIESSPKGYRLPEPEDLLFPFCFSPEYQDQIIHLLQTRSTMDIARELAQDPASHFTVVIAEHQTVGRGRLNRKWYSSDGGLWFTLILKPDTPPPLSYLYNFAASLSLSQTLNTLFDVNVSVKWPNDLLLKGKKLAGLLSETQTRGDMVEFINIGIGLNVNNHPEKDEPKAISLQNAVGRRLCRKQILEAFLDDFKHQTAHMDPADIIFRWKQQTSTIRSRVRIETLGEMYEGEPWMWMTRVR